MQLQTTKKETTETIDISFLFYISATLAFLKLVGHLDYTWIQVTSPLWFPLVMFFGIVLFLCIGVVILEGMERLLKKFGK